MDKKILIVGGYGSVGRVIATQLGKRFPGQVIVAGRNYQKAEELALELGKQILPMSLDVSHISEDDKLLDEVGMVIMCLDQDNSEFVRQCLRRGIHYVDISASYSLLCQVEALNREAETSGATAVLSVGLAPGLTNLLVKHSQSKLPDITRADIYVLLGSGEAYGDAALQWTFESLNSSFTILNNGVSKQVKSFEEGKQTVFPGGIGKRTAYRFDFSDQHVLPRTLGLKSVSTWLCFDDAASTQLLAFLRKSGLSHILKIKSVEKVLIDLMKRFPYGSEEFVIKVEAGNQETDVLYECSLRGDVQGRITGWVAARVAEKLVSSSLPAGVFHIEQVFDPGEFFADLAELGVKFEEGEYTASGSKA